MESPLYQHYLALARQALEEDSRGIDPVGGRTQYNHRFNDYRGPRTSGGRPEKFVQSIGPFENHSKIHPTAHIVFYDDAEPAPAAHGKAGARPKARR